MCVHVSTMSGCLVDVFAFVCESKGSSTFPSMPSVDCLELAYGIVITFGCFNICYYCSQCVPYRIAVDAFVILNNACVCMWDAMLLLGYRLKPSNNYYFRLECTVLLPYSVSMEHRRRSNFANKLHNQLSIRPVNGERLNDRKRE